MIERIGVVVVDDDAISRQLIVFYLQDYSQILILGEASNAEEALKLIEDAKPAVVFLDIELPEINGLAAAGMFKKQNPDIEIVFITGYPMYAAQAFEVEALDYLVKPITRESLHRTVNKIERYLSADRRPNLDNPGKQLAIQFQHELYLLKLDDIIYIEKTGRHSKFHTVHNRYNCTDTLSTILEKLNQRFFRCSRSFIINMDKVERIMPVADRSYEVSFYDYPSKVSMGRKQYEEFCRLAIAGGIKHNQ